MTFSDMPIVIPVHINVLLVTGMLIYMKLFVILVLVKEIKMLQPVPVHTDLFQMKMISVPIVPIHVPIVNILETHVLYVAISDLIFQLVSVQKDTMIMVINLNVNHVIIFVLLVLMDMVVKSVKLTEPNNHQPVLVKMDISTLMKLVNVILVNQNVKLAPTNVADVALVPMVEETTHHTVHVHLEPSKLKEAVLNVTTDVKLVEKETQDIVSIVLLTDKTYHGNVHVTMDIMKNLLMKNVIHVTIPVPPVPPDLNSIVQIVLDKELSQKIKLVSVQLDHMKIQTVSVNLVLQNVDNVLLILITVLNVLNKDKLVLNLHVHV